MYKEVGTVSISCVKPGLYSTSFFEATFVVANLPGIYPQKHPVMHSRYTSFFKDFSLLFSSFTRFTQRLLLKLLIYLKKGY